MKVNKKRLIAYGTAALIIGVLCIVASVMGNVSADMVATDTNGAIKAFLIFGGSMIGLSAIIFLIAMS